MTKRNPREERIMAIHQALTNAARQNEMNWPRAGLADPMVTGDQHILLKSRVHDTDAIKQAATIGDAILINADGFATMFALAASKPKEFQALAVWAGIERERKPAAEAA